MGHDDLLFLGQLLTSQEAPLLAVLEQLGIAYIRHEHPPVSTVAEAEVYWTGIPAAHCKNLFLRNQKGDRHYLVIVSHSKRADLRQLAVQIGDGKLSFASPERLMTHLGVTPGSVSPFGLLNDASHHVRVFVDADLSRAQRITFHPNINTVTLELSVADFGRFLAHTGHAVRTVTV
jgi:Ala-tRNA(Pro) deacylase